MTAPDNWGELVAPVDVHTSPAEVPGAGLPSPGELLVFVKNLIEGLIREVVRAVVGVVLPGDAGAQLTAWANGIASFANEIVDRIQLIIDTILTALTKLPVIGGTLEDLFQMLGLIPADNVTGGGGPATIIDSFFAIINKILGGAVGVPGAEGGSLADLENVMGKLGSGSYLGEESWRIVNMLNNTPVSQGFMATGRANYDWQSTNTYLPTTQANSLSVSFGLQQAMPLGVFSWCGYGTAGMTAFYFNVRKVNLTTGVRSLVFHSGNIIGELQPGTTAADAAFMFCELTNAIAGEAVDYYYGEFVPVGGTHYVRGMSFTDSIPDHPTAAVPCVATAVNYTSGPNTPTVDLPKASSKPDVPWLEFAVSKGDVADHREPQKWSLDFDGETLPIPSWANRVDRIVVGTGGHGANSGALDLLGFAGKPGQPGQVSADTLARGTDFGDDATILTFNVLPDGSAKLSIPGNENTAAPGAAGAGTQFGLKPVGKGPGVLTYNDQTYTFGGDQKVAGQPGTDPGGGGNGGDGLFFAAGGKGGKPIAWVCFRQVEVVDETPTGDVTPPTPPTSMTVVEATPSTLTVDWSGATDV